MYIKLIGAFMIIAGCGGFGFYMAAAHKAEETTLTRLTAILDYMECELQYRLTPLPTLCRQAASESTGILRNVFQNLSCELEGQVSPDVASCMHAAIMKSPRIPALTERCLKLLGSSLGRFDLQGQLRGLDSVRGFCRTKIAELSRNRDTRIRSYQTLSLCAGAALAILLI